MWGIKLRLFRIDADPLVLSRDEDRAVRLESTATEMWFYDQLALFDYNYVYGPRVYLSTLKKKKKKKKKKKREYHQTRTNIERI